MWWLGLLALSEGALLRTGTRTRARSIFDTYAGVFSAPVCDCSCCIVERRNPSEVDGDVTAKCAVMPPNDPRRQQFDCPDECTVINDAILSNTNTVAAQRFCFYKCMAALPTYPDTQVAKQNDVNAGYHGGALVDSICSPISENAVEAAVASDGNGRDAEEGAR